MKKYIFLVGLCVSLAVYASDASVLTEAEKALAREELGSADLKNKNILDQMTELRYRPKDGSRPKIDSTKQQYWRARPYGVLSYVGVPQEASQEELTHAENNEEGEPWVYQVPSLRHPFWFEELIHNPTGVLSENRLWVDVINEWAARDFMSTNVNVPMSHRITTDKPYHTNKLDITYYPQFLKDLHRQRGERISVANKTIPFAMLPVLISLVHDLRLSRGNLKQTFKRFWAGLRGKKLDGTKNVKGAFLRWLSLVPLAWAIARRIGVSASYHGAIKKAEARLPHVQARLKAQVYPRQHAHLQGDWYKKSLNQARQKAGLPEFSFAP